MSSRAPARVILSAAKDLLLRNDATSPGVWKRRLYLWGPVVACMAGIFWLSSQPKPPDILWLSRMLGKMLFINHQDHSDKLKHLAAYAVLGALIWRALTRRNPKWWQVAATVALATAYGLTDESHQIYVPGRSFDLLDLSADAVGAALAALVLTKWKGGGKYGEETQRRRG